MLSMAQDVIAVDFEFRMPQMGHPEIRCMSAISLKNGKQWDYWADEFPDSPPFSFGPDTVFLMHFGEAEAACFLALDWVSLNAFSIHTKLSHSFRHALLKKYMVKSNCQYRGIQGEAWLPH